MPRRAKRNGKRIHRTGSGPTRKALRRMAGASDWLGFEHLEPRLVLSPVINEFLAVNDHGLTDEDGERSDWIEVHNPSADPLPLAGWSLTDDAADLDKWVFPAVTLGPGGYMTVFADGKNRRDPASTLHTNFKLDAAGEYLGLVEPGGITVSHEYSPAFPPQYSDISYGLLQEETTLLAENSPLSYQVPTDGSLGNTWTARGFDDSGWTSSILPGQSPAVLITEVSTGDVDAVEIENASGQAVDTSGWVVAVNDPSGGINSVHATLWGLSGSMASGAISYRTDNPANHYWGSDIPWTPEGNGWAMIVDNSGAVVDFAVWGYSPANLASLNVTVNGFHVTEGTAWSGSSVPADGTISNSLERSGNADHNDASDFAFAAPSSLGSQNAGLVTPFGLSSGAQAKTGIGFESAPPGFLVTCYKANVIVDSLAAAEGVIRDPAMQSWALSETAPVVNYVNTGGGANFGNDSTFPGLRIGVDAEDFVVEALATVYVPSAGQWTFGVNSDDGFSVTLIGNSQQLGFSYPYPRAPGDTVSVLSFAAAGAYDLRLVFYERGGGSELELFAAKGSYAGFDSSAFHLVGDSAGELQVTTSGGVASAVAALAPTAYWRFGEAGGTTALSFGSLGTGANGTYQSGAATAPPAPAPPPRPAFRTTTRASIWMAQAATSPPPPA